MKGSVPTNIIDCPVSSTYTSPSKGLPDAAMQTKALSASSFSILEAILSINAHGAGTTLLKAHDEETIDDTHLTVCAHSLTEFENSDFRLA